MGRFSPFHFLQNIFDPLKVLDRCPGGDYAGFSHTYVIEANVTEENNGKMTEKIFKRNNLALCGTVEERTRFCHNFKILYRHFLLLQRPWGQSTYKPTRGMLQHVDTYRNIFHLDDV